MLKTKLAPASLPRAEYFFDETDRSYSDRAYATAAKLPVGQPMQLHLEAPDYRPRFTVPVEPRAKAGPSAAKAGNAARDDAEDAAKAVLDLFPDRVRSAILDMCAEEPSRGPVSSGERGGMPRRLVEVVVDLGRRPVVRFSDDTEQDLDEQLDIQARSPPHALGGLLGEGTDASAPCPSMDCLSKQLLLATRKSALAARPSKRRRRPWSPCVQRAAASSACSTRTTAPASRARCTASAPCAAATARSWG
jgi:hypothetical protein